METKYEYKPSMTFIGFSTRIRPEEGYEKCPEFWEREYSRKYARLWQTMKPENEMEKAILANGIGLYAICNEKDGDFEYWIAGLYQGGEVPEGLHLFSFPEGEWAVFITNAKFGFRSAEPMGRNRRIAWWLHDFDRDLIKALPS